MSKLSKDDARKLSDALADAGVRKKIAASGDASAALSEVGLTQGVLPDEFLATLSSMTEEELGTLANVHANTAPHVSISSGFTYF